MSCTVGEQLLSAGAEQTGTLDDIAIIEIDRDVSGLLQDGDVKVLDGNGGSTPTMQAWALCLDL